MTRFNRLVPPPESSRSPHAKEPRQCRPRPREYRYNRLTWPEMNEAIAAPEAGDPAHRIDRAARPPSAAGRGYLPVRIASAWRSAGSAPDQVLVLPPVAYGLNLHHIDFPGTIHIEPEVFIAFCLNITKSVAYHGFRKILLVNGHGSNAPADRPGRAQDGAGDRVAVLRDRLLLVPAWRPSRRCGRSGSWPTPTNSRPRSTCTWPPSGSRWTRPVEDNDVMGRYRQLATARRPTSSASTTTGADGPRRRPRRPDQGHGREGPPHLRGRRRGLIALVDELRAWPIAERADHAHGAGAVADQVVDHAIAWRIREHGRSISWPFGPVSRLAALLAAQYSGVTFNLLA